jgi:ribose 5-phosphate isomerase B
MTRNVITARDLESVATGAELAIAPDTLITPLAQEEAARRAITFRVTQSPAAPEVSAIVSPAQKVTTIALGADHGGFELKEQLKGYLRDWGYRVLDQGTDSVTAVDYPDFAEAVALAVARGEAELGIVLDSAGIGSAMAANKVPGARAALCYDRATARNSREHNDANILSLGARLISPEAAREIVAVWLQTPFAGGRHERRVNKIRAIEKRHSRVD